MTRTPRQLFPDMSRASTPQRIEYIRTGAIFDSSARLRLREHLTELVRRPKDTDYKLLFLTAPPGMGLTRLIEGFADQHPPNTDWSNGHPKVPIVNVEINPSGEIIDYCEDLREKYPVPGYGPTNRLMSFRRTLSLLSQVETRMVILEDFHRTYSFQKHQKVAYQNYVHHLISKYDIRVVLTGPKRIYSWAIEDEQVFSRSEHLEYRAWAPRDEDFIEFLEGFENWCPVTDGGTLSTDSRLQKSIIGKTNGICGEIMRVLSSFAVFAIVSGCERLDLETWLNFRDQDIAI